MDHSEYETAAELLLVEATQLASERRDELMTRVGPVFARREPRLQAGKYAQGG